MSGGHYEYRYAHILSLAEDISSTPEREKLKRLLVLVAKACRDIEWVDSGDMMDGDENEAIKAVFDFAKSIDKHFAS